MSKRQHNDDESHYLIIAYEYHDVLESQTRSNIFSHTALLEKLTHTTVILDKEGKRPPLLPAAKHPINAPTTANSLSHLFLQIYVSSLTISLHVLNICKSQVF